jgi:hypothetical protein
MVWDLTDQYLDNFAVNDDSVTIAPFDPFNNQPMVISYNFTHAGRVSIALGPTNPVAPNCDPPQFCLAFQEYQASGERTITWAGVDHSGALRPDVRSLGVVSRRTTFSANAIVVYGTTTQLSNLVVVPPVFGPAVGLQEVAFDLATFAGDLADVTITFQNQASLSVLRTIDLPDQTPGHAVVQWDGRSENGMWVAPGTYTVTVTARDSVGNVAKGQILTTIQY